MSHLPSELSQLDAAELGVGTPPPLTPDVCASPLRTLPPLKLPHRLPEAPKWDSTLPCGPETLQGLVPIFFSTDALLESSMAGVLESFLLKKSLTSEPCPAPSLTPPYAVPLPQSYPCCKPLSSPTFLSIPAPVMPPSSQSRHARGPVNLVAHPIGDSELLWDHSSRGCFDLPLSTPTGRSRVTGCVSLMLPSWEHKRCPVSV